MYKNHNGASTSKSVPHYVQPRRQLTQKEFEDKRAKNLCFYCDQRYTPGHKCSCQLNSLEILPEELSDMNEMTGKEEESENVLDVLDGGLEGPHISLNALFGVSAYQTMRIRGYVGKQMMQNCLMCLSYVSNEYGRETSCDQGRIALSRRFKKSLGRV